MDIKAIVEKFCEEFYDGDKITSVGYTKGAKEEIIMIYTNFACTKKNLKGYPAIYHGVPVEYQYLGKIKVKTSKGGGV